MRLCHPILQLRSDREEGWRPSRSQNKTLVSPAKCPYFGPGAPVSSIVLPALEHLPDSILFSVKPSGS